MSSMLLAAAAAALAPAATPAATPIPAPTITAEQALANARALTAAVPPKVPECPDASGDEIVVCAKQEDPAKQYVPSNTDSGDTYDGVPHAPDVSGLPSCASAGVCVRVGKKPPDPLIIDLKAIPEPPAGSDADRIARGEMAAP